MGDVWQDLRHAFRTLGRSSGFTATAVVLLALGIGANTAVFSIVHAVLLRPLPYPQPDRLVRMVDSDRSDVSIPEFQFWKQHASAYSSIAGYDEGLQDRGLETGSGFEWVKVTSVTQDFLNTLGVSPALGREFNADETRRGGPQAIILSDRLWQRAFGGNLEVLGRAVKLGKTSYTIIGVLPRDFWFSPVPDALVPLQPSGSVGDNGTNTAMIARLKPGVSLTQAEAERATLGERFRETGVTELPARYGGLAPISYQTFLAGDLRDKLLLLLGAVGLLLLIACSNLAGLLLARMAARSKDTAVRLALGSSTRRLLRQSLAENLVLSAAGGLAGLLVASWLLTGLLAFAPFSLDPAGSVTLDGPVLGFTFAIALGTSLVFSIAPLFAAARMDIFETLKTGKQGAAGRSNARAVLVTGQIALTVTLLVSAALLIETLHRLHQQDLGFSPQGVLTFWTPPSVERQNDPAALRNFEAALLDRLQALPGVRSAAGVNVLPLHGYNSFNNFPTEREGHPEQSIGGMEIRRVSPEYFQTMGVAILRGRSFVAADRATAPPVMLVNETLARQWWRQGDPLGDQVAIGRYKGKDLAPRDEEPIRRIVGVVADTRRKDVKEPPRATVYIPAEQSTWMSNGMNWVVRGNFPAGFAERLRQVVAEIDPRQRVERMRTMESIVESSTADSRFDAWLFGSFAGFALLLTAAGIYGLLAFSVTQRARELALRMAMGASRGRVLFLILRQGFVLIAIGLAIGFAGAAAVGRSLSSLLFNVHPADPLSYVAVAAVLLAAGLLASYLPARKAARVDPMTALRSE
jgi:putative ABC transport system permease protein